METAQFSLRPMTVDDAAGTLGIFQASIREVAAADYDGDQIEAWATVFDEPEAWWRSFGDSVAYVAVSAQETTAGFVNFYASPARDLPAGRAYLDRLYVAPDYQGRGAATALLSAVVDDVRGQGLSEIVSDASITARPFFERRGFALLQAQDVELRGLVFRNYRMQRRLV